MRRIFYIAFIFAGMTFQSCFWGAKTVTLGENRLSIDLLAGGKPLNAQGSVYINDKFIGMTNPQGDLNIKLPRGEYAIRIALNGYETWEESILIVGKGYSQSVYPEMKKVVTNWSADSR